MKTVTVFTPTYNRAYTLPKLYNSLCRQTSGDFMWLIVDDGSTDNTEELIKGWQEENKILIEYHKQSNGGKMRAHNLGVKLCNSELFFCVDSDDYIPDVAIEHIIDFWNEHTDRNNIAGIIGYRYVIDNENDKNPKILSRFGVDYPVTDQELTNRGFKGDNAKIFRTDIIRQYPFPEIEGEKFISEVSAFDRIWQDYKMFLMDEAVTTSLYLPDGYSKNFRHILMSNPKGTALVCNQSLKFWGHEMSLGIKLRRLTKYITMSRLAGNNDIYRDSAVKMPLYPFCYIISLFLKPYYKCELKSIENKSQINK